jgi:hypothetical protein
MCCQCLDGILVPARSSSELCNAQPSELIIKSCIVQYAMPSSRDDYYYDDNGYYHYSDFYNVESGGVVALFYAVGGTSVGQGLGATSR